MNKDPEKEYRRLILSQRFDHKSLDYSLLQKHVAAISELSDRLGLAVTIFDNCKMEHVYVSDYHKRLFGTDEMRVHPDDMADVLMNATMALKHVFQGNRNYGHIKVIREYRAKVDDRFMRVTESLQVLETDALGNIWLVLCALEISPNQLPPFSVNSQIINTATGEVFSPLTRLFQNKSILTEREVAVLNLIARGKLSKEISDALNIKLFTVNTYRQRILKKLNVNNSHEAVRYGEALGIIEY